ncbi:MAG: pyruvate formate-lyase-activating protein [Rhodospirillaceae bacterium]
MNYICPHPDCPSALDGRRDCSCDGFLHSVETGAAVDGPGMRFVYFLSGCMFRCLYCHNPDTWKVGGGRRVSIEEALAEVAPYAGFLRRAGGVTVSGGEPLVQAGFVGELLARLKADYRLHTALDTQGFLHRNLPDPWFDAMDLALLDIKHIDPEKHRTLTGCDVEPTLSFAQRLARLGKPMWIRHVLVPGMTDDPADLAQLADFVAGLGSAVERVEILPLHHLGAFKWKELGKPYALEDTPTPTPQQLAAARTVFAERGLVVF